jgi:ATP-binding cassette subfamily C (CFTR/MRP) protein 1
MDQGQIAEMDTPANLYNQGGIFRSMCERSGIHREDFQG